MSHGLEQVTLLAPSGNLGSGFLESSFRIGLEQSPDVIACDSGTNDGGPSYLGTAKPQFPRRMYERDLALLVPAALRTKTPLIIGSAAGAGTDAGVDFLSSLVVEIAAREGLTMSLARIYAEQDRAFVVSQLALGKLHPLWPEQSLTEGTITKATRIVAMMGTEPISQAIEDGADVVIAGRASDSALFAAIPIQRGVDAAASWHCGKVLECGAAATVARLVPDCMLGVVANDGFTVWPPNPEMRCSTLSVAAHTLYENADPFLMREPPGTLDTANCRFEQVDDRRVHVSGSRFTPAPAYTVKLEAAEFVGFHAVALAGIRDPKILASLDDFLEEVRARTEVKVMDALGLKPDQFILAFRAFGSDAVSMRSDPSTVEAPSEIGLLINAFADSEDQSELIVATAHYVALHNPVRGWTGMVTNLAVPHSPPVMRRGPAFRFSLNHTLELEDPVEPFRTEYESFAN